MSDAQEVDIITGPYLLALWERRNEGKKVGDEGYTSQRALARELGIGFNRMHGLLWRAQQARAKGKQPSREHLFTSRLGKPLSLKGDWVLVGDVHAPTTRYDLAQWVSIIGRKFRIPNLLIAGDLLNQDWFSKYDPESKLIDWEDEIAAARVLLLEWLEYFKRIVWLAGNHERRLRKETWGALTMLNMRDMILGDRRIEVSEYGYCTIDTPNGVYRVTHPKNYSRLPLKTANELALKYGQHAVVFHQHHLCKGLASCGGLVIANGGGLFDQEAMAYVALADSNAPRMANGFCVLQGGYLTVLGEEPFTDWTKYAKAI